MRVKDSHYLVYQLDSKTSNNLLHAFIDVLLGGVSKRLGGYTSWQPPVCHVIKKCLTLWSFLSCFILFTSVHFAIH